MDSEGGDSIAVLSRAVRSFCEARDWDQFHSPKDLAIGLATESAELLANFRFLTAEQVAQRLGDEKDRLAIEQEVGDVLFFLLRFCQRCEIDPGNALMQKLAINEEKYPVDRARGSNLKYDRL